MRYSLILQYFTRYLRLFDAATPAPAKISRPRPRRGAPPEFSGPAPGVVAARPGAGFAGARPRPRQTLQLNFEIDPNLDTTRNLDSKC